MRLKQNATQLIDRFHSMQGQSSILHPAVLHSMTHPPSPIPHPPLQKSVANPTNYRYKS
ncbi:MAG: hypothetical protein ACAF41_04875 [Leptolyngbya sp. BL-A-14]